MIDGLSTDFRGRYDIVRQLGKGAFGLVVEARQLSLERAVAIKFLHGEKGSPILNEQRFLREAKILHALTHPNIVEVYEFGYDGTLPYIVTELLDGCSLDEMLEERGKLPWREAVDLGIQIAKGLDAAHEKGVLHRDLKTANVFIVEGKRVKLLDFGLAKREGVDATLTKTRQIVGTPMYAAPEQLRGEKLLPATDLYGLGVILYRMIAGAHPFPQGWYQMVSAKLDNPARPLHIHCDDSVPEELCELVDSLLAIEVEERPQKGNRVAQKLERIKKRGKRKRAGGEQKKQLLPALVLLLFLMLLGAHSIYERWKQSNQEVSAISIRGQVTGARFSWATSVKCATALKYRTAEGPWLFAGQGNTRRHEVLLSGLTPASTYEVVIVTDGKEWPASKFQTLEAFEVKSFALKKVAAARVTFAITLTSACQASITVAAPGAPETTVKRELNFEKGERDFEVIGLSPKSSYVAALVLKKGERVIHKELSFETPIVSSTVLWAPVLGQAAALSPDISSVYMGSFRPRAAERPVDGALTVCLGKTGLHCIDLVTNKVRWSHPKEGQIAAISQWGAAAYTIDRQGYVTAWALRDGKRLWRHNSKKKARYHAHGLAGRAALFSGPWGVFYWKSRGGVVCLDGDRGQVLWQQNSKGLSSLYWTVSEGKTWTYRLKKGMEAYDAATGKRLKALDIPKGRMVSAPPVVAGERFFVARRDGVLLCRDLSGKSLFSRKLSGRIRRLSANEETVFAATSKPIELIAVSAKTGNVRWRLPLEKPAFSFLHLHRGCLYFEDTSDAIYCCALERARILWKRNSKCMTGFDLVPFAEGLIYCSNTIDVLALRD